MMTYKEFLNHLNHYKKKITFQDITGKEHFLYSKFVILDDGGNIDHNRQTELFYQNNKNCYDWIKENKPKLLTKI